MFVSGLALFTALVIYMLPALVDDPPFIAPDLEPQRAPVPTEGNFALVLIELGEIQELGDPDELAVAFDIATEEGQLEEFLASEAGARFLREYWEPRRMVLGRLDAALDLPHCEFPPPPEMALEKTNHAVLSLRPLADGLWKRVLLAELESGDAHLEALVSLVRFSARLSEARNGTFIDYMGRVSTVVLAVHSSAQWLERSDSPTHMRRILELLFEIELDLTMVSRAIIEDYAQLRDVVENYDEFAELKNGSVGLLFLRQRTLRLAGEYYRDAIVEGESTSRVTTEFPLNNEPSIRSTLREGNPVGQALLGMMLLDVPKIYAKQSQFVSLLDLTRLQFALRIRELESGSLPDSLEALVPEFFPAVPADPFTSNPYRFDPERRIVWGVGTDGVDDAGAADEDELKPDIVVDIPGPE